MVVFNDCEPNPGFGGENTPQATQQCIGKHTLLAVASRARKTLEGAVLSTRKFQRSSLTSDTVI
jgi:hypothetical protein